MLSFLEYFFSALVAFSPAERAKVAGPGTAGDANSLNQPPALSEIDEELRLLKNISNISVVIWVF